MAVSCSKAEVVGVEENEDAPVAVKLSTNLKVNDVALTKAGVDQWNAQKLYIYALPTNTIPATGSTDILIENASADAPANASDDPYGKKLITLYKDAEARTFYYYPVAKTTFDFYAYYVDDAAGDTPTPTVTAGTSIVLPVTLTGSQDIMLAKADKVADVEGKGIAPSSAYSAYSARKDVQPNLVFLHHLTRFVFNLIAGNTGGQNVQIKSVTLSSLSTAKLVIANLRGNTGLTDTGTEATFTLQPIDAEHPITSFKPRLSEDLQFETGDRIGESIMVIPAASHHLVITMQQTDGAETPAALGEEFTYVYDLTPDQVTNATVGETFLAGYQYNVNVVVYGRQDVKINVTLSKWNDGGSIKIDNDTEWGEEPKLGYKAKNEEGAEFYLYFYSEPIAVGTEVRVWDQASNLMVPAAAGTYVFAENKGSEQSPLWGVTLETSGEGEAAKTTVSALVTEQPETTTE